MMCNNSQTVEMLLNNEKNRKIIVLIKLNKNKIHETLDRSNLTFFKFHTIAYIFLIKIQMEGKKKKKKKCIFVFRNNNLHESFM